MIENEYPTANSPQDSATNRVFSILYDAVISLALPPGTKVSEVSIAQQLCVSRQPVRDAFYRLGALGFLEIRPQRPTLISKISEKAVVDAVFTRTALEIECLRTIIIKNEMACLPVLKNVLQKQEQALSDDNPAVYHSHDEEFHRVLCDSARHPHVWKLIIEQKAHMDRVRYLTLSNTQRGRVLKEHSEIVTAIEAKNIQHAESLLRSHINGVLTILPKIKKRFPQHFGES